MATLKKIIKVLKEDGYGVSADTIMRINQLIECLRDDNKFHNMDEVLRWLQKQRKNCKMEVEEIGIRELEGWHIDSESGNICHNSGKFFSVIGLRVSNTLKREVDSWTQPAVWQKEGGILGILCKRFSGVRHYLIHAKAEPGNIHKLQLSPTLQATFSNLKRAHGGNKPKFSEYFEYPNKRKIVYNRLFAEDGGRFYLKTNYNMLVEVPEDEKIDIPEDYIWLTMYQIKQLLKYDTIVNPHVRSVVSYF